MCKKITLLARAGKCVGLGAVGSLAAAAADSWPSKQLSAIEPRPMPASCRRARRVTAKCGVPSAECGVAGISVLGDRLVEIEEDMRNIEPGGPVRGVYAIWQFALDLQRLDCLRTDAVVIESVLIGGMH